jgi:predicted lipoprotein
MQVPVSFAKPFGSLFRIQVLAIGIALAGCGAGGDKAADKPQDAVDAPARRVLLRNLGERVIIPTYKDAEAQARALAKSSATLAAAQTDANLKGARAAWTKAMLSWERAEVMQVGPAASKGPHHPGGESMRDEIYFWPAIDECGIDRCLVTKCYTAKDFGTATLPNVRGLSALEVLLFDERTSSACPADHTVVTAKAWSAIAKELGKRRAAYAKACSDELVKRTGALVSAWQDDFLEQLATAGDGSEVFASSREAVSAVASSLMYISSWTKDRKLARPVFCKSMTCAEETEHPFAKISKESILANLDAVRDVFKGLPPAQRGTAQWGLFDLATSLGASWFPSQLEVTLYNADSAVAALSGSLEAGLTMQATETMAVFTNLEDLSSHLKSDMPMALDVTLSDDVTHSND